MPLPKPTGCSASTAGIADRQPAGGVLLVAHGGEADGGKAFLFQQLGRFESAMADNDYIGIVDQYRIVEAERSDAVRVLPNLGLEMAARIARINGSRSALMSGGLVPRLSRR
jgi:hypothetical protein